MDNSLNHEERFQIKNRMRQYSAELYQPTTTGPILTHSSHPTGQFNELPPNNLILSGENRRSSDVRSLIEQLMKSKDVKVHHGFLPNSAQPVLLNTEEKIFQEVVNLLVEIQELKIQISNEKEETLKLQAEREHLRKQKNVKIEKEKKFDDFDMQSIINKLKGREGEDLRLSAAELQKFNTENEYLEEKINNLKMKNKGNYEELLENQKNRHQELKRKLQEKKRLLSQEDTGADRQITQQIESLKSDIVRLKNQDYFDVDGEVRRLNEDNERLRSKTIQILKSNSEEDEDSEERERLQGYIRKQQRNKMLFFQDLKKFKLQYQNLKQENEMLKERLKSRNNSSLTNIDFLATESVHKKENKFAEYQEIMKKMKSISK